MIRKQPQDGQRTHWDVRGSVQYAHDVVQAGGPKGLKVLIRAEWAGGREEEVGWLEPAPQRGMTRRFRIGWSRSTQPNVDRRTPGWLTLEGPDRPSAFWAQAFADEGQRSLKIRVPFPEPNLHLALRDAAWQEQHQAHITALLRAGKRPLTLRVIPAAENRFVVRPVKEVAIGLAGEVRYTDKRTGVAVFEVYPGAYEISPGSAYLYEDPEKRRVVISKDSRGEVVTFHLRKDLTRVRGVVLDARTGKPVDRPSLALTPIPEPSDRFRTNQFHGGRDGQFRSGLQPPGNYTLGVGGGWNQPYFDKDTKITLPTSAPLVIRLEPKRLAMILRAEFSPPLPKTRDPVKGVIYIWHREGHEWRKVFASSMDDWRQPEHLWGYPAGDYKIVPALDDYLAIPQEQRVQVAAAGEPTTVRLRFVKK